MVKLEENSNQDPRNRLGHSTSFALPNSSRVVSKIIAMSLNYGYTYVIKALEQADSQLNFTELKNMLTCLSIAMDLDEEKELREYLISKDLVKIERKDMLLDIELKLDTQAFIKLLKKMIHRADPNANFDEILDFPKDPKTLLNNMKNDLLESCLLDLQTRANIFMDSDQYIPEIKVKEIFYEIFPNFNSKKLNQFLVILENKRKASKYNSYQDSYSVKEILYKIREGETYRQEDLAHFKSTMRQNIAEAQQIKKNNDVLNGEILGYQRSVFKQSERAPLLKNTFKKMKDIFELINGNSKVQTLLYKGLIEDKDQIEVNSSPHHRFGSVDVPEINQAKHKSGEKLVFQKEELPLTLPLIKFCIADDVHQIGVFREELFVSQLQDWFPSVTEAEAYQLSGIGKNYISGDIDYMKVAGELETQIKLLQMQES